VGLREHGAVADGGRTMIGYRACGQAISDIQAIVVDASLSVLTTFPITDDGGPKGLPALASTNTGTVLAAYPMFRFEAPLGTSRVYARIVDFVLCATDAECNGDQCLGGICVDGGGGGGGAAGSGGMAGAGGAGGTAGAGGGAAGSGGSPGSGGTGGTAGSGGAPGGTGAGGGPGEDPGCACRAAGTGATPGEALAAGLIALLAAARRRKRRPETCCTKN
jgi:MYXO-CTERM domain-containing protein